MKNHTLLSKIEKIQIIDKDTVTILYNLAQKSILVSLIFSFLVAVGLYPFFHNVILVWFIVMVAISIIRFYLIYAYKSSPYKFSVKKWYRLFVIFNITSALLFSSLGYYFIYFVDPYFQLYIILAVLGLSFGVASSLSADIRLNIAYISILVLPLFFTTFFLTEMPFHVIISLSLFFYYAVWVHRNYQIYIQAIALNNSQSQEKLMHTIFKNAPIGMFTFDENYTIVDSNKELTKIFRNDAKNIIGMNLMKLPDLSASDIFKKALEEDVSVYCGSYVSIYGKVFRMDIKSFSFTSNSGKKIGIGMIEDKRKEYKTQEKLEHMVQHDILTGLLNRRGFTNYIEHFTQEQKHASYYSILYYLDLNQFKSINDSLGHAVGDQVLLLVSKCLHNTFGKECILSRFDGDEFIVMVPYIASNKVEVKKISKKYSKVIKDIFLESFIVKEIPLYIKASIGILFIEPGFRDTEEILRHANLTMYQAKKDKNHIAYYDKSFDKKQKELFTLQHDLAHAIVNHQLELYLQPIVKMKDESLYSAELLIRWKHPTKGILSPESFIPLAVKAGLLSKISWWSLETLCQKIVQWKDNGEWKLEYISININPEQLLENHFTRKFFKILKLYSIQTNEIMIEITERSLIDNFVATRGVINDLKSHGVRCAIDDFGTGYSSLSYLKKLSFHTLKIDRTFVKDIGQSPKELILMNTILDIGRQFGYSIIIEGIENDQQKQALLGLDDNLYYQGYFYSKPSNMKEFTKKFLS